MRLVINELEAREGLADCFDGNLIHAKLMLEIAADMFRKGVPICRFVAASGERKAYWAVGWYDFADKLLSDFLWIGDLAECMVKAAKWALEQK